ncbi:hypothetical protein J6590_029742 [Homalodisca vitripennis]|nr:hypothetical protein J6590_029742 [Homalodisca vitripennis]
MVSDKTIFFNNLVFHTSTIKLVRGTGSPGPLTFHPHSSSLYGSTVHLEIRCAASDTTGNNFTVRLVAMCCFRTQQDLSVIELRLNTLIGKFRATGFVEDAELSSRPCKLDERKLLDISDSVACIGTYHTNDELKAMITAYIRGITVLQLGKRLSKHTVGESGVISHTGAISHNLLFGSAVDLDCVGQCCSLSAKSTSFPSVEISSQH